MSFCVLLRARTAHAKHSAEVVFRELIVICEISASCIGDGLVSLLSEVGNVNAMQCNDKCQNSWQMGAFLNLR